MKKLEPGDSSTRSVIVRLLSNLGSSREVAQYLKLYRGVDSQRFAIIKVGGAILRSSLDELASSLSFLAQVGLHPIVVHGAGPQLDVALEEAGIRSERVDGQRVTSPEVLEVARRVFQRENLRLVEALESLGTGARPITGGVFEATQASDRLGLVGEVQRVRTEAIRSSIRSGHLPIIAPLGETAAGQILNLNADVAARELALSVQPHKIVFLTGTGGLLDGHGRLVSAVNLCEDFEVLMTKPWVHSGMRLKLQEIRQLLDGLPDTSSVSITSPNHLAAELFTHKGSGTLVRRGERVLRHSRFEEIDTDRIRALLEACFSRQLKPSYFEDKTPHVIYLAESYRATAILTLEGDVPYLDKFGVTTRAQGLGLGGSIWSRMTRDHQQLFWRAQPNNPINGWYFQQADGAFKTKDWTIFWYGLSGFDAIKGCIDRALAMPATLREHGTAEWEHGRGRRR